MGEEIKLACDILRQGGTILYPTDTVWGIGCDATQSEAVKRVFKLKQRADNKALIVMLGNIEMLSNYVEKVPPIAYDLINLTTKPLTIVYDNGINLAENLLGEDGSVGIRITTETFSQMLCTAYHRPIVSTSANISGSKAPSFFAEISDEIKNNVDYIVKYGQEDKTPHLPSSVIKLEFDGTIKILRD